MTKSSIKISAVIVLVIAVGFIISYATQPDPIVVSVAKVSIGPVEQTVTNTRAGTVMACRRARLAPTIGGQIANMPVKEGQKVTTNEILVELWNKDIKAELTLAQNELSAVKASAREACIRHETAQHESERVTKLYQQKLASEDQAEKVQGVAKAAKAACDAASNRKNVAISRIEVVRAALERTIIRAPFDGVVAEINGEIGEYVTPSPVGVPTLPVVDLIDYQCIYVLAPIDEVDAPAVKVGLPARITLDAFPNYPFEATVHRISPYIQDVEKQARTVDVEVYFSHTVGEQRLLPGYSADAEIILTRKDKVTRVPTETIFDENHVYVYLDNTGTLEKRQIEKGIGNWSYTEILSGLNDGDKVVTSIGIEGLTDGITVELENNPAP
ncbi:efflux RND transporter periplasmic adaptor subunit [Kaarinaea lacus]